MGDVNTLDGFLAACTGGDEHDLIEIELSEYGTHSARFIVIRHGEYAAVVHPMRFNDHLDLDVHAFKDGKLVTAGVFGMTEGRRSTLEATGTTSHGWPSARLIAVLIGQQGVGE